MRLDHVTPAPLQERDALRELLYRLRADGAGEPISLVSVVREAHRRGLSPSWADLARVQGAYPRAISPETLRSEHVLRLAGAIGVALDIGSALDPFAASPAFLSAVATADVDFRGVGLVASRELADVALALDATHRIEWRLGAAGTSRGDVEEFDWIVSSPPIGLRRNDVAEEEVPGDLPLGLVRQDAGLLPAYESLPGIRKGVLVLVGEGTLRRENGWVRAFAARGFHLNAAVSVPDGLAPSAHVSTLLCVFRRSRPDTVFVGRAGPASDVVTLAANLAAHRPAKTIELGAVVQPREFAGWESFSAARRLDVVIKRSPWPFVPLGDLVEQRDADDKSPPDEAGANSLFVSTGPLVGRAAAMTTPAADNGQHTRRVVEFRLDPARALAPFLASWLNGETGRVALTSVSAGAAVPAVHANALAGMPVPVPELEVQEECSRLGARISALRDQLEDLDHHLWRRPWEAPVVDDNLAVAVEQDSVRGWMDSLPFPLASIVQRYRADSQAKDKVEKLNFLFEAFAEYMAMVLLSILRRDDAMWVNQRASLVRLGGDRGHPLVRGDFGGWLRLAQHAAKAIRDRRRDALVGTTRESEKVDVTRAIFGVGDLHFADVAADTRLYQVLERASGVRNDTRGHGGLTGEEKARRQLALLEEILEEVRSETARMFRRIELVQPGAGKKAKGLRTYDRARVLRGPVAIFEERSLAMPSSIDMDAESLCLVDRSDEVVEDALVLIPLVRMRPTPDTEENAAFFYNRQDGAGFRFVSYHFAGDVDESLDDPELSDSIADLTDAAL